MTGAAVRLEVRRSRLLVAALVAAVVVYAGIIAAFYPTMRQNTQLIDQYVQMFPKGFLAAFGMSGSLGDPGVFYSTYLGSFLWPVVAAVAAIVLATRPVAGDLAGGWLELALATPISRVRLLAVAIAGQVVVIALVAVVMLGSMIVGGALVGASFPADRFALVLPLEIAFGWAIAGPTTLFSVLTLSRGRAAGIATGILIAMYLVRIVVGIQPDLGWLGGLSFFQYGDRARVIATGTPPVAESLVLVVVGLVGWAAALVLFRRRDLAA